jgi:hypothetical protein
MGKWFIEGGMRRGTAKADYENVITVYGGTDAWRQRLGVKAGDAKAEDTAYLVLLDRKGNVVWRHAGPLEEAAYQALAAQVRRLLAGQKWVGAHKIDVLERETGIEPATSSLGSWRSTAELLPLTGEQS